MKRVKGTVTPEGRVVVDPNRLYRARRTKADVRQETARRCAEIADDLTEAAGKEHRFLGSDIAQEIRREFGLDAEAK